ncbi:MAG: ABC transporter permease [Candidatus Thorarchaeota archaeon]
MTEQQVEETSATNEIRGTLDRTVARLTSREFLNTIIATIASIVMALIVAAMIMLATGYNPLNAFSALFFGAILQFDLVLYNATPLLLAGLSVALAFKCGLFNIGAEGQLYIGSIVATAVGYMIALPFGIHQIVALGAGVLSGLLYGLLPGILRAYRGAHEVVTTMMLSYSSVLLTQWLVSQGPMHNPGDSRSVSPFIFDTAFLPKLFGSAFLNWGFIIAVGCVILVEFFINRTVMGYEMRAVGQNEEAAKTAGINSKRNMALALGLSGGLAGLAGSEEVLGYYHRFYDQWSGGIGFDGITVAVLGRNNPWGVLGGALFFGALKAGGGYMQTIAGVPSEMVGVIQGLVVLFVAAPRLVEWLANRGIGYAQWIVKKPKEGVPSIIALAFGIMTANFAMLMLATLMIANVLLALLGLLIIIMGLVVIVLHLKIDERRFGVTTATFILWLIMLLTGMMFIPMGTVSVVAIMTGFGFVVTMLLAYTEDATSIQLGGEQ